ncbi:MAG: asparagine synthase (glutamine-hydrolyzing) [Pseudomonadota bacterium]
MCGICGQYNFKSREPVFSDRLRVMNETLRHRGPNDEGYYIDGPVGLSMRRLSIIDVIGGKQPIHNEDQTLWIVFNGEIFNYSELRHNLEKKGHRFSTASDTETIIHLYEDYGESCVDYLRGMFAFALWDTRHQSLFLARDRIGIKPLFFSVVNDEKILFASEIKALLASSEIVPEMDLQALDAFFAYGYIPSPLSIYKGIRKLLPGHFLRVDPKGITIKKYWDLYFQPDYGKSEIYFIEKFQEIFSEAVKIRLLSEVPLGAFLSGGVDSSMVVAHMAQSLKTPPETFTVGFSGNTGGFLDERPYSRLVADKYGCNHHEIEVEPKVDDILDEIVRAFDEPFADDSVIPSYYICKVSKQWVTVALTGLGGDELFGGYERYLGFRLSLLYDCIPSFISKCMLSPIIEILPERKDGHYAVNHMKRFMRAAHLPLIDRYRSYVSAMPVDLRSGLYDPAIARTIDFEATDRLMGDYFSSNNAETPLDRMFYQDIKTYLPDDILALTDRLGMLHSQELRVPFTDHLLVEFCATIPAEMKLKRFQKKYLLKKAADGFIPKEVLNHRKQGFASPMAQWLKGDLTALRKKLLSKENIEAGGILNWEFVNRMIFEHLNRKELNDKVIFALIMFQKWKENIEKSY